nr:hypothetical protein [Tanacetum cinerariifolium]
MAARGQNQEKGKNKLAYAPKPKIPPPPKREDPTKDSICHECGETGDWKMNCPQYLDELLKKKKNTASEAGGLGIFTIELNTFLNRSWIYDTSVETMGYSFYYPPKNKVSVGRNVEFIKNSLIDQEANGSLKDLEIIQKEDMHPSIDTILHHEEDYLEMDKPQRDLGEPANYNVALLDPESDIWTDAMNVEIQSMKDNEVWDLVKLPPDGKTVSSKWLFKKKTDMDGARFHMKNSKGGSIPMHEKLRLSKSQGASTPAELKHVQNVLCLSSGLYYNPGDLHWTTVKNILKYLMNTKYMFLVYRGDIKRELRVSCYTDAGYLTDADDLKSQTRYVFVLNGDVVDWKSAKQSLFATSSAEAEYIAAYDDSKEAVWVKKFISGLGVVPISKEPINMYWYNTGAITLANESGITKGARHFHDKVHSLREYGISEALYLELPGLEERIVDFPEGKQEAGENTPQCYTKPLDSLKNWNNRFFWVDERVFPTIVDWRTSAPKDGMPAENTYSPEAVMILNTHRTPIQKQPGALLCLVGLSRRYYLGDEVYPTFLHDDDRDMDLFSLIQAPNPTKVKTGTRPRAAHEVPLLTVTASRVIEMEDPAATTDSSREWEKESSYDSPMPRKRSLSFRQSSFEVFSLWGRLLPRGRSLESVLRELLDVNPEGSIRVSWISCRICDSGHEGSCVDHCTHSFESNPWSKTPLALSWERITRFDSGVRAQSPAFYWGEWWKVVGSRESGGEELGNTGDGLQGGGGKNGV